MNRAGKVLVGFGENMRTRRRKLGMTQQQLADNVGMHRTFIFDVECGKKNPTLVTIARIAEALNTTIASLTKRI